MSASTWWLWLTLAIAGTAANDVWRMAGVWLSRGVDPVSPIMMWVRDVSTALVAGLIARLLLSPTGELAAIGAGVRFAAFATGVAAFFFSRRNLSFALVCAEAMFFFSNWALSAWM